MRVQKMKRTILLISILPVAALSLFYLASGQGQGRKLVDVDNPMRVDPKEHLKHLKLPKGFRIELFAENVENARSMTSGKNGTIFVGSRKAGKVYALPDRNNDHKADQVLTIAEGLTTPNGVAFHEGNLYIAEISRILRLDNIEERLTNPPEPVVVSDRYPKDTHHGWKFIRFGPDKKLYVPVGAPCNICERKEQVYASITRVNADGSNFEIFARGIRNTVGFDWHPQTKELWFTENGRDEMGDDIPPEELNLAPTKGLHFGFPYRYGKALDDPSFKPPASASTFQSPVLEMPAHVAALGMRFYTGKSFPQAYQGQIFLAEHGSWNRSVPSGYRVSLVRLNGNEAVKYEQFVTGWLINNKYWGRPVDIEVLADGSILVSDDFADCIYRISYGG